MIKGISPQAGSAPACTEAEGKTPADCNGLSRPVLGNLLTAASLFPRVFWGMRGPEWGLWMSGKGRQPGKQAGLPPAACAGVCAASWHLTKRKAVRVRQDRPTATPRYYTESAGLID